jgi:hydrogenase maturation protein HypF
MSLNTYKLSINGTVQGVGFRPFIYTLAQKYTLKGRVSNNSNGVEIILYISRDTLENFIQEIYNTLPPLASITSLSIKEINHKKFKDFKIVKTQNSGDIIANIPPDMGICKACVKELFDPHNRRYGYAFITCTDCGVRYSIINDLPYDRVATSMKKFEMCKLCKEEYQNPLNRRYHAEPIGCFDCGAKLILDDRPQNEIIDRVVAYIKKGLIIAIKGVGGYHLVCDGTNPNAIKRLRERKKRPHKPFAMMVKNINMAKKFAYINPKEKELLLSKERPIVLLKSKNIENSIAPNLSSIGLFLPYTPLHILILNSLNRPLVATSANITDEPISTDTKSIKKLSNVYDYLLDHDRDIINACDDSLLMLVADKTIFLRRARGYTPLAIKLPFKLKDKILAVGANQKSTIAIGFDDQVILSPYIGDLNSIASVNYFKTHIDNLKRIYRFSPQIVACDKHPKYESTRYAKSLSIPNKQVQHHHAHILAVMAQKSITSSVLGVAFDGTGLGDDAKLWGGEFMICNYQGYQRVAHIEYFKLLGGTKAIKEPKRVALSLLFDCYGADVMNISNPTTQAFLSSELKIQYTMWKKGLNSPKSSSMGRLFDAISSLSGICQTMSFEAQGAMLMEKYYDKDIKESYPFIYKDEIIHIIPMIKAITKESNPKIIISKFFNTIIEIIYSVHKAHNLPLVLSGGVFQNRVLLEQLLLKIPTAIIGDRVSPNDESIALGQVVAMAHK